MRQIPARLRDDIYDRLKRRAERSNESMNRIVNDVLDAGLALPDAGATAGRAQLRERAVRLGLLRRSGAGRAGGAVSPRPGLTA